MDTANGECFELNRIGAEIWASLARGQQQDAIATSLAQRYAISEGSAQEDVGVLINDLVRHGLLVRPG